MAERFYRTADGEASGDQIPDPPLASRGDVERAVGAVLFNVSNFPELAQVRLIGFVVNRLKAIWWIMLGRSVAFRVVAGPSGLRANGFRRLYFTESRIERSGE